MMIRILTCVALTAGAWLTVPLPAQGAESYDNCTGFVSSLPATISTQGTWCLDKDLSTAMTSGSAITIATNNVTLDCNHFKIGGLAAGAGTTTYGVYALTRLNATIRNCNIRGFFTGIHLAGGGGHLVEDNSLDGSTHSGILMAGSASTIRNNLVIDTGGSTAYTGFTIGIRAEEGAAVLDNTVNGVAPIDAALAIGIFSFGARAQKNLCAHPAGCAFRRSRCPIGCVREYAVLPFPFPYPRPPDRGRRPCRQAQDDEGPPGLEGPASRLAATSGSLSGT
jgi:parallel beta-helix repeat protein